MEDQRACEKKDLKIHEHALYRMWTYFGRMKAANFEYFFFWHLA